MLLAHISDIHCGPEFQQDKVETAISEINRMEPDLVVVTGDLTSSGLREEYRAAQETISQIDAETLVLPGNHDERNVGYRVFNEIFGEAPKKTRLDGGIIVGVDSAEPDIDEGHIGREQARWLRQTLREDSDFKIFALHHHLVPVPHTGREMNVLVDAGDILRLLLEEGVSLVLAGHRHVPFLWKVYDLHILHAGTLGSNRLRGSPTQSYNVLRVKKGILEITLRFVGEAGKPVGRFSVWDRASTYPEAYLDALGVPSQTSGG